MEFFNELYIGKDIADIDLIVYMLKNVKEPAGIFCICKKNNGGKFMYEIMSSDEAIRLIRDGDCICVRDKYTVYGIAAGKYEAFELLRYMLEDRHEF